MLLFTAAGATLFAAEHAPGNHADHDDGDNDADD
jgi:hypothetical protein